MTLTIDEILAAPTLPSLPGVAMEVLELARMPEVDMHEIARVIQADQALAMRVLKTVNSSFFGLSKPCPTIDRAVGLLGVNTTTTLVLGFSLRGLGSSDALSDFDMEAFWRRSVISSTAARQVAQLTRKADPAEAFTAALLQDIGMLAMFSADTPRYNALVAKAGGDHEKLPLVEHEHLEFTHLDVGARLAVQWQLPETIVEPILHHHPGLKAERTTELINTVRFAVRMARAIDNADSSDQLADLWTCGTEQFGLTPKSITELVRSTADHAQELSRQFSVGIGGAIDVRRLLAEAEEARIAHSVALERRSEELARENEELARRATKDGLTGLKNRMAFDHEFAERFRTTRDVRGSIALVMCDADHFKMINDSHGHPAGDAVLVELGRRLEAVVGASGTVCRYGGEEFAIILPGAGARRAVTIAEQLRTRIACQPIKLPGAGAAVPSINVTASLGVALVDPMIGSGYENPDAMISAADRALYAAKAAGRNCTRILRNRCAA